MWAWALALGSVAEAELRLPASQALKTVLVRELDRLGDMAPAGQARRAGVLLADSAAQVALAPVGQAHLAAAALVVEPVAQAAELAQAALLAAVVPVAQAVPVVAPCKAAWTRKPA